MRNRFATIVVEPSAFIREGIIRVLGATRFRIIASADCIEDLDLASLPQTRSMLLVIGTGENPRAAIRQIEVFKEWHPAGRIAVLGGCWDLRDMASVFRTGANACFVNVAAFDTLIKTLELVMLGETILPSAILLPYILKSTAPTEPLLTANAGPSTHIDGDRTPHLSAREKCVLHYLVEGHSNKMIARKMEIAEPTVKAHVKAILRKIQVFNRTQAALWAISHGVSAVDVASQDRHASRPAMSSGRNGPERSLRPDRSAMLGKTELGAIPDHQSDGPRTHSGATQKSRVANGTGDAADPVTTPVDTKQPNRSGFFEEPG